MGVTEQLGVVTMRCRNADGTECRNSSVYPKELEVQSCEYDLNEHVGKYLMNV